MSKLTNARSRRSDASGVGITRRSLLKGAAAIGASAIAVGMPYVVRAASQELVIVGWGGDLTDAIVGAFKDATGIEIKKVLAATDQEMFTKVRGGGGSAFDIVYANAGFCPLYYKAELTEAFQADEVGASRDLYPIFLENTAFPYILEPGKILLFPRTWAPFAMMWGTDSYTPSEPFSWNAMWDPKIPEGRVIFSGGSGDDFLALTVIANGVAARDAYSMNDDQLSAAELKLKSLRRFQVLAGADTEFRSRFRDGRAWIGLAAQVGAAELANREAGKMIAKTAIPAEGTLGWVDGPQLVKGASNRDNAIKFMNFLGSSELYWDHIFDHSGNAPCSRVQVERFVGQGGSRADLIKVIQADKPELAKDMIMQAPPANPKQYAAVWDRLQSSIN